MLKRWLLTAMLSVLPCAAAHAQAPKVSVDDMVMVLGTVDAAKQACHMKMTDFPLKAAVAKLGVDLTDFMPGGKHAALVQAKANEQADFIHMLGIDRGCAAMQGILKIFLPDIYR
jgi:hypothetical protein